MARRLIGVTATLILLSPMNLRADPAADLLAKYRSEGAGRFSAAAGNALWNRIRVDPRSGQERRCASCHTADLEKRGRHLRTGKTIEPMAPSVNPARLGDRRKLEKWFKRNCKWTLGRECSPQEKGDLLAFISSH